MMKLRDMNFNERVCVVDYDNDVLDIPSADSRCIAATGQLTSRLTDMRKFCFEPFHTLVVCDYGFDPAVFGGDELDHHVIDGCVDVLSRTLGSQDVVGVKIGAMDDEAIDRFDGIDFTDSHGDVDFFADLVREVAYGVQSQA